VAHACNPTYSEDRDEEDHVQTLKGQIVCKTLSQKYPTQKRAGGVIQIIECLPSKVLSSTNLSTIYNKEGLSFMFDTVGSTTY
jgi:aspartyl aminopeptidase